jgi:hypothetical protein
VDLLGTRFTTLEEHRATAAKAAGLAARAPPDPQGDAVKISINHLNQPAASGVRFATSGR